jgi:hypothetical protein
MAEKFFALRENFKLAMEDAGFHSVCSQKMLPST